MVDSKTTQTPLHPDNEVLQELYQDAMSMPPSKEREEALGAVWQMMGELALQEQVRVSVESDIAKAKELALSATESRRQKKSGGEQEQNERTYKITQEQIGWISGEPEITLSRRTTPEGKTFWLGRTTELSGKTSVDSSFLPDDKYQEVEAIVTEHIGQKLDAPDQRVRDLRPLRSIDDTTKHTQLNPYSDDGITLEGYRSGDIRALVLGGTTEVEGAPQEPMFLVASVCRHDQDKSRIYQL